jgi:PAS domain S-box-containing protein/putative nucleotidyltransferase with HDIG domain
MMEGFTFQADKALLDTVFDGVVVIDLKHLRISLANKAAADILGFNYPEELTGVDPLNHVSPEHRERATTTLAGLVSSSCLQSGAEIRVLDKKGKDVWILARGVKLASNGSSVLLASFRDITAQKLAEIALREAEERQIQLLNSSSELILISQDWKIVFANRRFQEATALSEDALVRMSILDITHPDDREAVARRYRKMLAGKYVSSDRAFKGIGKDGKTAWGMMRHVPFTWQGKPALMTIVQDITRQKLAEEALQESERRYRLITENITDVVWALDMNLNTTYVSPSVVHQKGYTVEEAMKLPLEEQMTPETLARIKSAIVEELVLEETGKADPRRSRTAEGETYRKDGSKLWVEITASFLRDQDGKPIGIMGITRDITKRKQAEEALKDSEAVYKRLFENTQTAMEVISGETGLVVLANDTTARMFGFDSADDLIGVDSLEYLLPEDRDRVAAEMARALAENDRSGATEMSVRTKDGRWLWINALVTYVQHRGKTYLLISLVDLTSRKQAEQTLRESEEKNRLLVDNAAEAIIVVQDGALKFVNPKATEISGYSAEELLSRSFLDLVYPDDRQVIADNYAKRLAGEETLNNYWLRIVDKAGGTKWLQINTVQLSWEGRPAVLSMLNDVTERRQAEEAFRESESRYRLLVENVSDVIWSVDMKSKRVLFSPSVTRLIGYTLQEAQGIKMKEVVSPTSYPKAMMAFSELLGKQGNGSDGRSSSAQIEIELMRKDGSFVWVDISVTLLRDAKGQPAELFGVIRDVTQRRKVEEDLRTSEEYFRALIENAWDAIAIVNAEGTMLYESPSSARILGYEPEEIVGKNLADFVRPEDIAAIAGTFRRLRTEPGSIVMVDAGFRHKDGHYIECEGTLQNFLHDPKINGVVANYRDVTDRRRAEEAIRSSEERFRNLVEATSDWVWEVDPNGVYTYASPNVREVMGYEVGEIIGKSIFDYMPARESGRFSKVFRSHVAKREAFAFVESPRIHKDGRVIILETSGVPFFGDDGCLMGYRGIGRDITDRKKIEKDLENSLKKVEKTMEAAIQAISYTMETRDPYTTGHQRRVTQLACAIAKEMGIAPWQIDGIRVAGLLHDIGKIAVPTEILSKPGKLSDIEFSMIKAHPKVGFDILKNVEFEWPIARIVVQHHERLDGSGYPFGLRGKDILQESRILAVADVVEAMSSHRPYRPALGIDKALEELMRGDGTLYDSEVVRACAKVIKERGFKFQG